MSDREYRERPRVATVEDAGEDSDELVDARKSANAAAKRTNPELNTKGSYERRRNTSNGGDSGYASRAGTVDSGSSGRKERRKSELKIDTSIQERESRPYHYSATQSEPQQSSGRPVVQRSESKSASSTKFYKHREGECWICDKYGKHIDPPEGTQFPPASPVSVRHAPPVEDYAIDQPVQDQPRMRRSSSQRTSRPVSMYAGIAPDVVYRTTTAPSPFTMESPSYVYHPPTTPLYTPLTPVSYTQYQTSSVPQTLPPMETRTSYFVQSRPLPPPSQSRPVEPNRRASMLVQSERPVIQQGRSQDRDEVLYDRRPPLHSQKSSRDKIYDYQAMPPPPLPKQSQVVYPRRPTLQKAATATSASPVKEHRRSYSYEVDRDELPRLETVRERRAEPSLPPSSYKGPGAATSDRPSVKKGTSYDSKRHSINVASSTPIARRMTEPSTPSVERHERHEAEAEAYQRQRGSSDTIETSSPLTAEALRKVPKARPLTTRSETNSSQKSRNSSSKGSSGAKTGRSNSDLMMRINGIGIAVPSGNGQSITISHKGMNISVGGQGRSSEKEYVSSKLERAPSIISKTSKTSRNSGKEREKENRWDRERDGGRRSARDESLSDRVGRRSQSISRYEYRAVDHSEKEEPLVFGA